MAPSAQTPLAILYAAAETAQYLERQGAVLTGSSLTSGSFRLEGTQAGKRLVVLALFDTVPLGVQASLEVAVGRSVRSAGRTGDSHAHAARMAIKELVR